MDWQLEGFAEMQGLADRREADLRISADRGRVVQIRIKEGGFAPFGVILSTIAAVTDPAYPRPRSSGGV